ncbi:MAG TPA: oxygen-dependent coproporphyrinogen oxidase [Edaphocola sp.]|nr:oxygen-dependent coproporphyrinogen oxidase [Edaphocola sp.]
MQAEPTCKTATKAFRNRWTDYIHGLQDSICRALEQADGKARFQEERWLRDPDGNAGGGRTRIISSGAVFEKGGVNSSAVQGKITPPMIQALKLPPMTEGGRWFACGLSLVIHPFNPFVPTVHANWRYFELYDRDGQITDCWFGGGADLTPYYLFEEDARHFHKTLKNTIEPFGEDLYPKYKKQCDNYFNNAHRGFEMRGVGGVFYDHLRPGGTMDTEQLFAFQQANGGCFTEAYIPIVEKRKDLPFTDDHKYWQEIRRGRYVEFNLIHDRGTIFGLKTNGRTESILMSLPPTVRFDYNYQPLPGSEEEKLLRVCQQPKRWV